MPILPNQAQLTCVIEALRALGFDPREKLPTDSLLDEVRDGLIEAYQQLTGNMLPERPAPTDEQRTEWLELRCFEQQKLGLR